MLSALLIFMGLTSGLAQNEVALSEPSHLRSSYDRHHVRRLGSPKAAQEKAQQQAHDRATQQQRDMVEHEHLMNHMEHQSPTRIRSDSLSSSRESPMASSWDYSLSSSRESSRPPSRQNSIEKRRNPAEIQQQHHEVELRDLNETLINLAETDVENLARIFSNSHPKDVINPWEYNPTVTRKITKYTESRGNDYMRYSSKQFDDRIALFRELMELGTIKPGVFKEELRTLLLDMQVENRYMNERYKVMNGTLTRLSAISSRGGRFDTAKAFNVLDLDIIKLRFRNAKNRLIDVTSEVQRLENMRIEDFVANMDEIVNRVRKQKAKHIDSMAQVLEDDILFAALLGMHPDHTINILAKKEREKAVRDLWKEEGIDIAWIEDEAQNHANRVRYRSHLRKKNADASPQPKFDAHKLNSQSPLHREVSGTYPFGWKK